MNNDFRLLVAIFAACVLASSAAADDEVRTATAQKTTAQGIVTATVEQGGRTAQGIVPATVEQGGQTAQGIVPATVEQGGQTAQGIVPATFEKMVFAGDGGGELRYRIHVPTNIPDDTKLPLVLLLHGAGERGDDNQAQLKHGANEFVTAQRAERFPCILVVPQCPRDEKWVDADWNSLGSQGSFAAKPSPAMSLVFELLDELIERGNVDTSRLYVTGLSMGGYGSWYAAAAYHPSQDPNGGFAAMLAICGGGDSNWADRYDAVGMWAVHGDADTAVPVARSREMVAAVVKSGHPGEIRYTEYAGVGHDSWSQTYANDETYDWLFSQSRSR